MFIGLTHEPYNRKPSFFLVSVLDERPEVVDTVAALAAETISRQRGRRNGGVVVRVVAVEPDNKEENRRLQRKRLVQQTFISFLVGLEHCLLNVVYGFVDDSEKRSTVVRIFRFLAKLRDRTYSTM